MNESMDLDNVQVEPPDLATVESHINSIDTKKSSEFLNEIQTICVALKHFELDTVERKILSKILPIIYDKIEQDFSNNLSIFKIIDDTISIKGSLEEVFQLTETLQEILNYILDQNPVKIANIHSLGDFLPKYVHLFINHYNNSSNEYRNAYLEELSKITVVLKHFYESFLHLLGLVNLSLDDEESDAKALAEVILALCHMPNTWLPLDQSVIFSTWKCLGRIISNYSSLLASYLDVNVPIKLLTHSVCQILEQLVKENSDYEFELKKLVFLLKVVFKVWIYEFYDQLNEFASELLVFYVRVLRFSHEYYRFHKMPDEIIQQMAIHFYKVLERYLRHLLLPQRNVLKEHILNIPENFKKTNPYGLLILYNHLLKIMVDDDSDWSDIICPMVESIFETLRHCRQELFWKPYNIGLFDSLIVNITAAILVFDDTCQCPELLIKHLLRSDLFVSMLALDVYCLLIKNIHSQDCLSLLINLLYSIEDLTIGYFTHRPEMVFLALLLQRIFAFLGDPLKEQILKMFPPDRHIQVWRFLGFSNVPLYRVKEIMPRVIENTLDSIKPAGSAFDENYIINMGEGLYLISTANNLNFHDESLKEVVTFLESFWTNDFGEDVLDNNWLKYFIFRIDALSVVCMQNNCLSPQLVFSKLKTLAKNTSYWIPIYKIISMLLNSQLIHKQDIISQISDLLPLVMDKTTWLQENYLQMFLQLNKHNNETLNLLLDSLRPNLAQKVFEYIESSKKNQDNLNLIRQSYEVLKIAPKFEHKCITWNKNLKNPAPNFKFVSNNSTKFDTIKENVPNKRRHSDVKKPEIQQSKTRKMSPTKSIGDEEDSCASEVISRLKEDVKCLVKSCYREKLTGKDCSNLRMLMAQISSVMK